MGNYMKINLARYPFFQDKLLKYPPEQRKSFIQTTLESLGYSIPCILLVDENENEFWRFEVSLHGNCIFSQKDNFFKKAEKAREESFLLALNHYERNEIKNGLDK